MKARPVSGVDGAAPFQESAARVVQTRLDELLALGGQALEPEAATAQHDARIAAKRLRYVLEISGGCFGGEGDRARAAAKGLQGLLGDIHDCDVILPSAAGIPSLEALLRTRRSELFARFCDHWRDETDAGTWDALEQAL